MDDTGSEVGVLGAKLFERKRKQETDERSQNERVF